MGFQSTGFQNLGNWLARLVRLDLTVFDDVKDDAAATAPALAVMVAASFATGFGSWLWWITRDFGPGSAKSGLENAAQDEGLEECLAVAL